MPAAGADITIPVFFTGEGTEELVEHLPGVNENAIEKHEAMAKISLVVIAITGVVALVGLFFRKNRSAGKIVLAVCLLLSFSSFGTMAWTAHLGGLIRHSELQNGSSAGNINDETKEEEESFTDSLRRTEKTEKKKDENNDD